MAVDVGSSVSNHPALVLLNSTGASQRPPPSTRSNSVSVNFLSARRINYAIYLRRLPSFSSTRSTSSGVPRSTGSSSSETIPEESSSSDKEKVPFGYSRKDVLLIGLGVTLIGVVLKSGLEFAGVDSLQAGNVVQLLIVLGLTVGWISTYMFRVANKDMTYAQQLRDYENKVMQKRLEGLTEGELEALLEQVEEEKRRLASGEQLK